MTTTTATLSDVSALFPAPQIITTVDSVIFTDTLSATALFRQLGNDYENAGKKFFVVSAALYMFVGNDSARDIVKACWADSKHKSREYALKIFRACQAAEKLGKAADIRSVRTFAELTALGKETPVQTTTSEGAGTELDAALREQQANEAEKVRQAQREVSRLADMANALADLQASHASLLTIAAAAKGKQKNDLDALASNMGAQLATLSALMTRSEESTLPVQVAPIDAETLAAAELAA